MALKVVVLLFIAMLVLKEHNAMAGVIDCVKNYTTIENLAKCILDSGIPGTPCTFQCLTKSHVEDIPSCILHCFLPWGTISDETSNPTTTVCKIGCSLGLCSKFLNDNEIFGTCMKSCSENYCIGGNVALEKA
ncbi:hypothetical protein FXO38_26841 [Capsicum annuum]|uniref:uncharacterized protein LOC107845903 n=1 Tax=Capsicum annuum TaxID=4072 RepID=UPI0007BEEBAA|nr:uncharacterized protein LOC107845903 [Capsicum annuum]KAF3631006.1 hypothetical protein FXO38_26841 [Capsicum annuum]